MTGDEFAAIGGLNSYSINPDDQSVMHTPSGLYFRFDQADRLTLENAEARGRAVTQQDILVITRGAEEALRRHRGRKITGQFV
jgi:hypothetical protein